MRNYSWVLLLASTFSFPQALPSESPPNKTAQGSKQNDKVSVTDQKASSKPGQSATSDNKDGDLNLPVEPKPAAAITGDSSGVNGSAKGGQQPGLGTTQDPTLHAAVQEGLPDEVRDKIAKALESKGDKTVLVFDERGNLKRLIGLKASDITRYKSLGDFVANSDKPPVNSCQDPRPSGKCVICKDGTIICSNANFKGRGNISVVGSDPGASH